MKREILERLLAERVAQRTVVLATDMASGEQRLLHPFGSFESAGPGEDGAVEPALRAAAHAAVVNDESSICEIEGKEVFLQVYSPPRRLIVIGAVHIAQALCPMATLAGFDITVVDPRTAFANPERFPGVALSTEWPDHALASLSLDHRTAVVTLTHDPKLDDPALIAALGSPAFYIGCLGSKKTHGARRTRLGERGLDVAALDRLHGPVGMAIGARTPAEIAVSILAQIIAALRGGA
jgi:xanthine dehydrogenase accessory factor